MRKLLSHSALYFASSMAARGISFVLTPLYTRTLSAEDFGVLGLANTVLALAALVFGLGLHASISRLWFEDRRIVGTVSWFLLVAPALFLMFVLALHPDPFKLLPATPHLQLVLVAAWLSVFHALPQALFQVREEPLKATAYNLALVLTQFAAILALMHEGVVGVLKANVISHGLMAAVALLLVRPNRFDAGLLRQALVFSVPLVPHLISNWFLSLSDRMLLERYVAPELLGAYTLAYLFNAGCTLFGSAVTQALSPLVTRELKANPDSPEVPAAGRTAWAAMVSVCMLAAMFAPEALRWLAPRGPLDQAIVYVPWVVLGSAFQGAYFIVSQGTWFSLRTGWVGPLTIVAAAGNFLANLWLIPRYGALAAAVNTAVGYALLMLLHARLANALYPIAWRYGRGVIAAGVAVAAYVLVATYGFKIPIAALAIAAIWWVV